MEHQRIPAPGCRAPGDMRPRAGETAFVPVRGGHWPTALKSTTPPSRMPAILWNIRASAGQAAGLGVAVVAGGLRAIPFLMGRTEPSQNPNCTTPGCRLLQYQGPVLADGTPR